MKWLALFSLLTLTAAVFWARKRLRAARELAGALHRCGIAEQRGDLEAAEAALDCAQDAIPQCSRVLRPAAARAVATQRARLLYKLGDLDASATLTYEQLQQARAVT